MNKSSLYFQNYSRKKTNKINSSLFTYSKVTRSNVDDRDTTRKFYKREYTRYTELNKKCNVLCTSKTPTADQSFVGVFFLSFEIIIKIICNYPCDNRTNENCKNKKCNIHLYIAQEVLYKYNIA